MSHITNPQQFLASLPNKPGVYQMFDNAGTVLYVGKAKNLKKRVANYFRAALDAKTTALMEQVCNIKTIITSNENAALLLENNLIKKHRPRYNILFKDDKSFPYLFLSEHDFPRITIHRGPKKDKGKYFGPFPNASAVHKILHLAQKVFRLRTCNDHFFRNRMRPCIQYQIGRCSAPCVKNIDKTAYAYSVKFFEQFLSGKSDTIIQEITKLMNAAAEKNEFETAAFYRDQIADLRSVQMQQAVVGESGDFDVVGIVKNESGFCINVLFVRNGLVLGDKNYFPENIVGVETEGEVLEAFLNQHQFKPTKHKQLLAMAKANAEHALKTRLYNANNYSICIESFKEFLQLKNIPKRIECFDVSHTQGESTVASCVVFNNFGPDKNSYRRYNITDTTPGDDYAALREALLRRYHNNENLPQIIIIDGGKGQLSIASEVVPKNIILLAIAKGPERRPGLEEVYIAGNDQVFVFDPSSPALHFLQQIRDEAHRFAISSHRKKMARARTGSVLDGISGVGPKKRALLLNYFGGLQELEGAGIADLAKVKGIDLELARRIYDYLHE